jgi:hypothetical protein
VDAAAPGGCCLIFTGAGDQSDPLQRTLGTPVNAGLLAAIMPLRFDSGFRSKRRQLVGQRHRREGLLGRRALGRIASGSAILWNFQSDRVVVVMLWRGDLDEKAPSIRMRIARGCGGAGRSPEPT